MTSTFRFGTAQSVVSTQTSNHKTLASESDRANRRRERRSPCLAAHEEQHSVGVLLIESSLRLIDSIPSISDK